MMKLFLLENGSYQCPYCGLFTGKPNEHQNDKGGWCHRQSLLLNAKQLGVSYTNGYEYSHNIFDVEEGQLPEFTESDVWEEEEVAKHSHDMQDAVATCKCGRTLTEVGGIWRCWHCEEKWLL